MSSSRAKAAAPRRETESAEDRAARREAKQQRVSSHRAEILRKVNVAKPVQKDREFFVCPIEYDNTLPELPVDAKFIAFPFDEDLLTAYDVLHGVSSEAALAHQLHAELDLGVKMALVDPAAFTAPAPSDVPPLDKEDEYITRAEFAKPATRAGRREGGGGGAGTAAGAGAAGVDDGGPVEWMMRPSMMHLDLHDSVYKHADADATKAAADARAHSALERRFVGSRRQRIEDGFAAVSRDAELVHPSNPRLQPKRVWEVLPDGDTAGVHYVHVTFDGDPHDGKADAPAAKRARLDRAFVRTPADVPTGAAAEGAVVVQYLLPRQEDVPGGGGGGAAAAPVVHADAVRDYHMVLQQTGTAGMGVAGAPPPKRRHATGARGGEDQLALFWDDAAATITFAPIRARATLTAVKLRGAAAAAASGGGGGDDGADGAGGSGSVLVLRRPALPEERDAEELALARMEESDSRPRVRAVYDRRRARQQAAAAVAPVVSAAVASAVAARGAAAGDTSARAASQSQSQSSAIDDADFAVAEDSGDDVM